VDGEAVARPVRRAEGEIGNQLLRECDMMKKEKRKYDITIDGYSIRNAADFDRVDMSKSERRRKHRKAKLKKKQIP